MSAMHKQDDGPEIPQMAPRAPTQAEWDRMDAEQRLQVIDSLVCGG